MSEPTRRETTSLESDFLQQVTHQATHTLARFFLEVDADYKQYQTAKKLRDAAAQRLEAQRAFYEEGRITIDRYLDAASQYSAAVGQEAQFKTVYNNAIVALEEAKGTLLEYDKITVVEHRGANEPKQPKPDGSVKAASLRSLALDGHEPAASPTPPTPVEPKAATPSPAAVGWTISFQVTINVVPRPVETRDSLPVSPVKSPDGARRP